MWGELIQSVLAGALAFAMGVSIGIMYDVLRPLRRRVKPLPAALLDFLFCLLSFAAVFSYAMTANSGALGLWDLTAALIGLLLYAHYVSALVYCFFSRSLDSLSSALRCFGKYIKKKPF